MAYTSFPEPDAPPEEGAIAPLVPPALSASSLSSTASTAAGVPKVWTAATAMEPVVPADPLMAVTGGGSSVPEEASALPQVPATTAPPEDHFTAFKNKMMLAAEEKERKQQEELERWSAGAFKRIDKLVLGGNEEWAGIDLSYDPDPARARRTTVVDGYLRVFLRGEPLPDRPLGRSMLRFQVAHRMFNGRGADSDEEFHAELSKAAEGRKDFQSLSAVMGEEAVKSMLIQSLQPGSGKTRTFADWRKENSGRIPADQEVLYMEMWSAMQSSVRDSLQRFGPELKEVWGAMKQGGSSTTVEVIKGLGRDIASGMPGLSHEAEKAWNRKDAGAVAFEIYKRISPEDRETFMSSLGVLARTFPKEQQADLMGNFAKAAGASVDEIARGIPDFAMRNSEALGRSATASITGNMVLPDHVAAELLYGKETADELTRRSKQAQADYLLARNFRADVRRIEQQAFAPTLYLSEDSKDAFSMRTLERGFYGMPGAVISSAVAVIPFGIGPALTYAHMESSAYDTLRFNFKDAKMSEEMASQYAGTLAPVVGIPSMLLEKVGASAWLGRLPVFEAAMTKLGNRISSDGVRFLVRAGATNVLETGTEVGQDLLPHIVQEAGAALTRDINGMKWTGQDGALDGFWSETASTFVSMLPLSFFCAAGGFSTDQRLKALASQSDQMLRAFGFTPERIAAFRVAQKLGPASMADALQEMDRTRDPRSGTARTAVEGLDRQAQMEKEAAEWLQQYGFLPRAERSADGKWTLYDANTGEIIGTTTNSEDAARMTAAHAKLDEDQHADHIAHITTAYQAAETTGQWAAEGGRSQETQLDLSRRLTAEEAARESDMTRNRAAAQERVKGGDGSATRLVFGQSTTETEDGLRKTVNRILGGGSILTVFHEDAHALRREAHARGVLTREDDIAIIRAVDAVLDGKTVRNRKGDEQDPAPPTRLSLLPENFDSISQADQDVAIDEAISELMEAEVIRTRKGGGTRQLPAGIISRNMAAIARLAGPKAAGRFGSFMEAFRSYFGLATNRAHHVRRGLADGSLDQASYDAYFGKLTGTTKADGKPITNQPVSLDPVKVAEFIGQEEDVSFSTGSDPSSGGSEARIKQATEEARKNVAAAGRESIKRTGRFWLSLHGEKGVSQLPELSGKDMRSLVDEAKQTFPNLKFFHWQDGDTDVTRLHDGVGEAEISVADGKVWVDTTRAGGLGSSSPAKWATRAKASMAPAVYQIAQAYAKNNGLQFVPDPFGVSTLATFRRWPQLLSSAIRMGDTSHIDGAKDVEGWKEGDHEHNTGLLALHEYEHVRHFFPEIDHLHLPEDSSTIVDDAGAPVPESTLADLLVGERHPSRLGIGETTLRRAIVTGQEAAEGRMESDSEVWGGSGRERRIHPGAIENFVPDLGSGDPGTRPRRHALDSISYSIGSDPTSDSSHQSHHQHYDEEGRMVPGNGGEQEVSGGSEEEIGRRIREALSRREGGDRQEHVGSGAESFVLPFAETEVLKEIKPSGVLRFTPEGKYQYDLGMEAAEEKARVINALGGMKTRAIAWEDRILIIQERGTPISETDYLSIELPFGIEPSRQGTYKIEIDGEEYLIADLKPENFVKDSQGNIRLIDLITGKVQREQR